VGFIFQLYNLMPVLTALENVELPLLLTHLSKAQRRKQVELALSVVNLSDRMDHFPRQLSGGQEQRVAIARAIAMDPKLLVADEPTGDLDAKSGEEILILLERLNDEFKKTIVMVTHAKAASARASPRAPRQGVLGGHPRRRRQGSGLGCGGPPRHELDETHAVVPAPRLQNVFRKKTWTILTPSIILPPRRCLWAVPASSTGPTRAPRAVCSASSRATRSAHELLPSRTRRRSAAPGEGANETGLGSSGRQRLDVLRALAVDPDVRGLRRRDHHRGTKAGWIADRTGVIVAKPRRELRLEAGDKFTLLGTSTPPTWS
jgi:hypothetical protein